MSCFLTTDQLNELLSTPYQLNELFFNNTPAKWVVFNNRLAKWVVIIGWTWKYTTAQTINKIRLKCVTKGEGAVSTNMKICYQCMAISLLNPGIEPGTPRLEVSRFSQSTALAIRPLCHWVTVAKWLKQERLKRESSNLEVPGSIPGFSSECWLLPYTGNIFSYKIRMNVSFHISYI